MIRKLPKYFIIAVAYYLIIFNNIVLGKGGGGKKNNDSGIGGGTSKSYTSSSSYSSGGGSRSSSSWVFFYYSGGNRYCGNLCIFIAILIPSIILLIIGCGIWRCYRIRKRYREEREQDEEMRFEDDVYVPTTTPDVPPPSYSPSNDHKYPIVDNYTNYTPGHSNYPMANYTPGHSNYSNSNYTPGHSNYPNYNMDDNYTNYAPGHSKLSPPLTENNYLNMKSDSKESLDSMSEFKKNKKK